jgi:hypothetical protein
VTTTRHSSVFAGFVQWIMVQSPCSYACQNLMINHKIVLPCSAMGFLPISLCNFVYKVHTVKFGTQKLETVTEMLYVWSARRFVRLYLKTASLAW